MNNVLLYDNTEHSADLRHHVPVSIIDPFLYAEVDGRRVAVIWSIEGDRVVAVDSGIETIAAETFPYDDMVRAGVDIYEMEATNIVRQVASLGLRDVVVPDRFPLKIADALRADGVTIRVDQRFFDDRRRIKNAAELAGIRVASVAADGAAAAISDLLARSQAGPDGRTVDGEPLTCELLKAAAAEVFAAHGCRGDDLIVAHGPQAADGHDPGSGRIANDDHVLCDIFPRHTESGCFSDMTRTFIVGEPDPEIMLWHGQVAEALELARGRIRPGANGAEVHREVCSFFEKLGYPTGLSKPEGTVLRDGFYHGLGHGVGLEVHEAPTLGKIGHDLVVGDVITLEPGLYRHGFGGVRLEDIVVVTENGCETLTTFPLGSTPRTG